MVEKSGQQQNRSIGTIIDELLNNPEIMMKQCGEFVKKTKEEAENLANKNKDLENEIIEKEKEIKYLDGKIYGMEYIIEHLNLKN